MYALNYKRLYNKYMNELHTKHFVKGLKFLRKWSKKVLALNMQHFFCNGSF